MILIIRAPKKGPPLFGNPHVAARGSLGMVRRDETENYDVIQAAVFKELRPCHLEVQGYTYVYVHIYLFIHINIYIYVYCGYRYAYVNLYT